MNKQVVIQKEMLAKLESELSNIKVFLIGNVPSEETCEDTTETCMLDVMRKNNYALDRCLALTYAIKEIVRGDDK